MEEIINFKNITKIYPGVKALNNISFSIRKGEIHAIVGENGAGKSTLMNLLSGEITPTEGSIIYESKPIKITHPHIARSIGISTVYQELKLCPNLTVCQNIFLGSEIKNKFGILKWQQMKKHTEQLLSIIGSKITPDQLVKNLTISQRQIVEIAKAVNLKSKILILDEPNTSLSFNETEALFENINNLKMQGATIIFISHRIEEVLKISDRITVLKDGKYIGTLNSNKTRFKEVVELITGKELLRELSSKSDEKTINKIVFEVSNFNIKGVLKDISFKLFEGEILGLYGLQGAGKTELMESIFGLQKIDSGELFYLGKKIKIKCPRDAIKNGIAMISEDRRSSGIFPNMDIKDNLCIANMKKVTIAGITLQNRMLKISDIYIKKFGIKITSKKQLIKNLSGGNQQKVIISRWLSTESKIILADEITRGIDVNAKAEIFSILKTLKEQGLSILFASSEIQEIIAECDRVLVLCNGRITGELNKNKINKEKLLSLAMQFN